MILCILIVLQERFPPNIYYKIFTHRPIVDMCANSPKDYTRAEAKKIKAKDTNTRNRATVNPNGGIASQTFSN